MIVQCQLDPRSANVNVILRKKKKEDERAHTVQIKRLRRVKMASKKHTRDEKKNKIKPNDVLQY